MNMHILLWIYLEKGPLTGIQALQSERSILSRDLSPALNMSLLLRNLTMPTMLCPRAFVLDIDHNFP